MWVKTNGHTVKGKLRGEEIFGKAEEVGETDRTGTDDKDFDFGFRCLGDHGV